MYIRLMIQFIILLKLRIMSIVEDSYNRKRVEVGAKTAPISTLFYLYIRVKALGSSLTSQIVAKSATNCNARLNTYY